MRKSTSPGDRSRARLRWAANNLKHEFSDEPLLTQALTHRSASRKNNERLEFLGDAVLNFCIARRVFDGQPEADEGALSRSRAALVNKRVLASIGRQLGVDDQLVLGSGELRSGGAHRDAALADAVEALIGAVLVDGGIDRAAALVDRLLGSRFEALPAAEDLKDPKTRLQEWLQGRGHELPVYSVAEISGSDHERRFKVGCSVEGLGLHVDGRGTSRRRAEQDAAANMLAELDNV